MMSWRLRKIGDMSKLQGQIVGGWTLFAGASTTVAANLLVTPEGIHTVLIGGGVTIMLGAVALLMWSFTGVPDATGPATRAIVPARAAEANNTRPRRAGRRAAAFRSPRSTPRRAV